MQKFIIIVISTFLLVFICGNAFAGTPLTKEQANNFYLNCKGKQDTRMRPESQDAMCACTSAAVMQAMSLEDIQVMSGNTPESRIALNKMLLHVYAPCMSYPVQDLVGMQCLSDPNIDKMGVKIPKESLCSCIAENTAAWFVNEGRTLMEEVLKKDPNILDPIGPIMETSSFKAQTYNSMVACMTRGK